MKKFTFLLLIMIFLSGCLTTSSFIKTVEKNPGLTIQEADKKLGLAKETYQLSNNITYKIYAPIGADIPDYIIAFFIDNKLCRYGKNNPFFILSVKRDLNFITEEEYQQEYNRLIKEQEYHRALALQAIQVMSTMQNIQYQQQSLYNQQQVINQNQEFLNTYKQQRQTQAITIPYPQQPIFNQKKSYEIRKNFFKDLSGNDVYVIEEK